ncbi:hypothetical protein GA0070618_4451 [Micromonospora echinospora]|uniref:Uncharacterized protein n=1 Tax=Micromonospora echinospora TaxID=1877 RepID=A0A1C4YVV3_MICEC|nr:hypothetical protein GA0070618_4451 [Micromonospora echinospora]
MGMGKTKRGERPRRVGPAPTAGTALPLHRRSLFVVAELAGRALGGDGVRHELFGDGSEIGEYGIDGLIGPAHRSGGGSGGAVMAGVAHNPEVVTTSR